MQIDGKEVKRFVFVRYSEILRRPIPVEVWAFGKDHAIMRLAKHYPFIQSRDWELIIELEKPEQTLGSMGEILKLNPTVLRNETN